MGWVSPHAGRARLAPSAAAIRRFGLQCLVAVGRVVIADRRHDPPVGSFHGVQLMVLVDRVAGPRGNLRQPAPGTAIVGRLARADSLRQSSRGLADIEQATVGQLRGAVRAVDQRIDRRRPGLAAIGRAERPAAEACLALRGIQSIAGSLPTGAFFGGPITCESSSSGS